MTEKQQTPTGTDPIEPEKPPEKPERVPEIVVPEGVKEDVRDILPGQPGGGSTPPVRGS